MSSTSTVGLDEAAAQPDEYFARTRATFDLPLAPAGDDFQRRMWDLVAEIPYGETRSDVAIAREFGDAQMAHVVGAANARNPLCVIVPCQRVVGADGRRVGYAGGHAATRLLLDLERSGSSLQAALPLELSPALS